MSSEKELRQKNSLIEHAAYALVHRTRDTARNLAEATGDPLQVIINRVSPHTLTHHARLVDAVAWERHTGDHRILFAHCEELGYSRPARLLPIDATASVVSEAMRAVKEFGDFFAAVEEAVRDGHVTQTELAAIRKEWAELEARVSSVMSCATQQAGQR